MINIPKTLWKYPSHPLFGSANRRGVACIFITPERSASNEPHEYVFCAKQIECAARCLIIIIISIYIAPNNYQNNSLSALQIVIITPAMPGYLGAHGKQRNRFLPVPIYYKKSRPGSRETTVSKMPCLGAYAPGGTRTTNPLITSQECEHTHVVYSPYCTCSDLTCHYCIFGFCP